MPIPEIDDENHVLLSSLDETVIQHGAEFNLGLHKFEGNNWSPKGHKNISVGGCRNHSSHNLSCGWSNVEKGKNIL